MRGSIGEVHSSTFPREIINSLPQTGHLRSAEARLPGIQSFTLYIN